MTSGGGATTAGLGAVLVDGEFARPPQRLPRLGHTLAPDLLRALVEVPIGLGRLEQVQLSFHGPIFPRGCDIQAGGGAGMRQIGRSEPRGPLP
jgi:hypothetical protein